MLQTIHQTMGLRDIAIEIADWLIGPLNPSWLMDPKLLAALKAVMKPAGASHPDPEFKDLGVALIDFGLTDVLDDDLSKGKTIPPPHIAMWNDTKRARIGSLGKIGVLYAAFQLREDLRTYPKLKDIYKLVCLW